MPSLIELQRRFAKALVVPAGTDDPRIGIYRRNIAGNYRNALSATYRVVRELVGTAFFDAATDGFVADFPSRSGDLNIYGAEFPAFLATYPHAQSLPYLPDVARLEWAIDDSAREADPIRTVADVVAALATFGADDLAAQTMQLGPPCRLLRSEYPVLQIWQAHEHGVAHDGSVNFEAGMDHLLIHRDAAGTIVERLAAADHAFLEVLARNHTFGAALDAALVLDPAFDLQGALARHIGSRTIAGVGAG